MRKHEEKIKKMKKIKIKKNVGATSPARALPWGCAQQAPKNNKRGSQWVLPFPP